MAVPTWPAALPQALQLANFQQSLAKNRIRSETETGPAKQRRRQTAATEPVRGVILVTREQLAALRSFWRDELGEGVLPFQWRAPDDPDTILLWRFVEEPSWNALGQGKSQVQLSLEILP